MARTITSTSASAKPRRTSGNTTPKGARIVRGPMASDHWTQVHNRLVRGAINTRYVGVFAYVASHIEGWELTAARVAKQLGVGEDFVGSALRAIEAAHCLIRTRERGPSGTLGGAIWFITDLPMQMLDAGVTDQTVIHAAVQSAYDQWAAARTDTTDAPVPENPGQAATCENTTNKQRFRRSAPNRDSPGQVNPGTKKTTGKKTKNQKTKKQISDPGPQGPVDVGHADARDAAARANDPDHDSSGTNDQDGPASAAWQVLAVLPREWRDCPAWIRRALARQITTAMTGRLGAGPDAIVHAVTRYGRALAAETTARSNRHTEALAAVLTALAGDLAAGACPTCGHHHTQDPATACTCCAGRHLTVVPAPARDAAVPQDLAAGVAGHCDVCGHDNPSATLRTDLPLPMAICNICRANADDVAAGDGPSVATGSLVGADA